MSRIWILSKYYLFNQPPPLCGMLKYNGRWFSNPEQWPHSRYYASLYDIYLDYAAIPDPSPTRLSPSSNSRTVLHPVPNSTWSPGILSASPKTHQVQRLSLCKCTVPHWCVVRRYNPQSAPDPHKILPNQSGDTPSGRSDTESYIHKSVTPSDYEDSPSPAEFKGWQPMTTNQRAAQTEPLPR